MKKCAVLSLLFLFAMGCTSDERLVRQAEQSVETQKQQNAAQARQSEIVAEQNQALAKAFQELVTTDSQARREILEAQREVRAEAAKLDDERRDLIAWRTKEPLVAGVIETIGGILLCLIPLVIAGFVLREMQRPELGADVINDFLLAEIAERPRLTLDAESTHKQESKPLFKK